MPFSIINKIHSLSPYIVICSQYKKKLAEAGEVCMLTLFYKNVVLFTSEKIQ